MWFAQGRAADVLIAEMRTRELLPEVAGSRSANNTLAGLHRFVKGLREFLTAPLLGLKHTA